MKKQLPAIFILVSLLIGSGANAQCDLTPTIVPGNPILCPGAKDTLVTTEAYDSYQWYKNNQPIPGATRRYYIIDQQQDAGSFFKVEVTKDSCTAFSKRVLVDGYVFLPPYIIETGDIGVYDPGRDALVECPNDTLILTIGVPYTENIQWYNNLKPIEDATNASYVVTKRGSYTACGSPAVCPDYTACESIPINVVFDEPVATITLSNDTLFASSGRKYQWFFSGREIPGATKNYLVPLRSGSYKVAVKDKYTCVALSETFVYTKLKAALDDLISFAPNPVEDVLQVHIKSAQVAEIVITDLYGNRVAHITSVKSDQTIPLQQLHTGAYMLQVMDYQKRMIASAKIFKQ